MKFVTVTRAPKESKIAVIAMAREPTNAMNLEFWQEITAAFNSLESDKSVDACVFVSGLARNVFTAGLDLQELYTPASSEERYLAFWKLFNQFIGRLYSSRLVTIAGIRGACPAGGCILAMACDCRIYLDEPGSAIGLNEPSFGVPVPGLAVQLMINLVGQRNAEYLATNGRMISPKEALSVGLVDQVLEPSMTRDDLHQACVEMATRLLKIPSVGRSLTKQSVRGELGKLYCDEERIREEAEGGWAGLSLPQSVAAVKARLAALEKGSKQSSNSKL